MRGALPREKRSRNREQHAGPTDGHRMLLLVFSSNLKLNMKQEPSKPLSGPRQAPDFKQVRKYLKDTSQRENLGEFIKVGWSPAELAEYARSIYLAPGRTYPTASSYQVAVSFGPECPVAKIILAQLRAPGYVIPPFDRPLPPPPIPRRPRSPGPHAGNQIGRAGDSAVSSEVGEQSGKHCRHLIQISPSNEDCGSAASVFSNDTARWRGHCCSKDWPSIADVRLLGDTVSFIGLLRSKELSPKRHGGISVASSRNRAA